MKAKPYSQIPALASRTQVGIHAYSLSGGLGADDFESHKAGWDITFPARSCLGGSVDLYGFELTGSDLTIDLPASKRRIGPSGANPSSLHAAHGLAALYYKGKAVPYSHLDYYTSSNGDFTITIAATPNYGATATDYVAWYGDWLKAFVMSASIGGVDMPLDTSSFKGVGIDEDVYKVVSRGDLASNGSLTVAFDLTAQIQDGDVLSWNAAASEIFTRWYNVDKRYFQSAWDDRKLIIDQYLDDRPGSSPQYASVSVLNRTGKRLDDTQGQLWGVLTTMFDCRITGMENYGNISNDSTDPISITLNFTTKFADRVNQVSILTTG